MEYQKLIESLKAFALGDIDIYDDVLHLKTENFLVRIWLERDLIEFGIREHFDRWANSVDYKASLPTDDVGLKAIYLAAEELLIAGEFDSEWSNAVDLGNKYRKVRQQLKSEIRNKGVVNKKEKE